MIYRARSRKKIESYFALFTWTERTIYKNKASCFELILKLFMLRERCISSLNWLTFKIFARLHQINLHIELNQLDSKRENTCNKSCLVKYLQYLCHERLWLPNVKLSVGLIHLVRYMYSRSQHLDINNLEVIANGNPI